MTLLLNGTEQKKAMATVMAIIQIRKYLGTKTG